MEVAMDEWRSKPPDSAGVWSRRRGSIHGKKVLVRRAWGEWWAFEPAEKPETGWLIGETWTLWDWRKEVADEENQDPVRS